MLATFLWAYWLIRQHWLLSKDLDSGKSSSFFTIRYLILKLLLYAIKPNIYVRVCVCVCVGCSVVSNSATPWTVACQAPLDWARILEWVVISYSRGSSQPRDQTPLSCIRRQIFYHCAMWEAVNSPELADALPSELPGKPILNLFSVPTLPGTFLPKRISIRLWARLCSLPLSCYLTVPGPSPCGLVWRACWASCIYRSARINVFITITSTSVGLNYIWLKQILSTFLIHKVTFLSIERSFQLNNRIV